MQVQNIANRKLPSYVVIIPAYNEESTVEQCLLHILQAAYRARQYELEKIVICLNGCTDNTREIIAKWEGHGVEIIESRPGYIHAMNKLFRHVKQTYPGRMMIKTDADAMVDEAAFSLLFKQLEKHNDLVIVGGHPVPIASSNPSPYRRMMSNILSVRSRIPEAEVTVKDTKKYHVYTDDPIPELLERETKMKIYFHGRLWCARDTKILPFLPSNVIGDDVYLPGWLLKQYGPGSMRLDYRAKVSFHPNDSVLRHWKVYRRIHEDRAIVYSMRGFEDYATACPMKLDWGYIFQSCQTKDVISFMLYGALVWVEKVSYRFVPYDPSYWHYRKKEV